MIRYSLRQLEYALAVQEKGSVAGAAAALGVAQPSISAALAKLEGQIGIQLFIRQHGQGVMATSQGVKFLGEARNLVSHASDLQRETEHAGMAIEGVFSVGSFMTLAPAFAPRLIAGFRRRHERAEIKLSEGTQNELLTGLRSGRHDLALLYSVDMPDDLTVTQLATVSPYVLLPVRHPLASRKTISLSQLAHESLVLLDVPPSRTYFLRILKAAGIEPEIAFSSPSLEVVRGLVGQGLGYSILVTRPFGDHSYDGERLAVRNIAGEAEHAVIVLATLKQMRKTRLISAFEEYCVEYFAKRQKRS
jgi:DNA-binding transcriptional LysR family regulator